MWKALLTLRLAVVGLALATAFPAHAQVNATNLPANTVVGRLGAGLPGPAQAIPFSTLATQLASAGLVTGPSSSTINDVPYFSNSTGNTLADSGIAYSSLLTSLKGGTTPITGTCTSGYFLYNNSGVLGCQVVNSAITANSTPTSGFSAGYLAYSDGSLIQAAANVTYSTSALNFASAEALQWNSGDVVLSRLGAGDLFLSHTTNATKFLVSSTTDSTTSRTNYADAYLQAGVNAGEFDLGSEHGGTGTALTNFKLLADGTPIMYVNNSTQNLYLMPGSIPVNAGTLNISLSYYGLANVTAGYNNIAIGSQNVLRFLVNGSGNIAIGAQAGVNYTGTENYNVILGGMGGTAAESNTIQIGDGQGNLWMDYGHTTSSVATFLHATTFTSATFKLTALANTATTSAVCYNTSTGLLTYDGTIGTCNTSDERLKTVDGPIVGALAMLMRVDGVYFHGKGQEGMAQFGDGEHVGLIAQNVAAVFPSLVQFGENGYASLAYDKLTAPIIASLHEIVDSCRDAANDNFCVQLLKRVNQR